MSDKKYLTIILLIFITATATAYAANTAENAVDKIITMQQQIYQLQAELNEVQDNYVSYDDIEPMAEAVDDIDGRLEAVEQDREYIQGLWDKFFDEGE